MGIEPTTSDIQSVLQTTEKRNGDIKARKVANGSKQRTYDGYDKSDGSSPTVVTESIFMTGVVDAKEKKCGYTGHSERFLTS